MSLVRGTPAAAHGRRATRVAGAARVRGAQGSLKRASRPPRHLSQAPGPARAALAPRPAGLRLDPRPHLGRPSS